MLLVSIGLHGDVGMQVHRREREGGLRGPEAFFYEKKPKMVLVGTLDKFCECLHFKAKLTCTA